MNVFITLSPKLNMTSDKFALAWNESEKHRAAGKAYPRVQESYDPGMVQQLLLDLTIGAMGGLIVELIKELFIQEGIKKRIWAQEITRPDGTHIVRIEIEEE